MPPHRVRDRDAHDRGVERLAVVGVFVLAAVLAAVAEGVLSVAAAAILYGGSAPDLTVRRRCRLAAVRPRLRDRLWLIVVASRALQNPSELKGGSVRFVAFLAITAYITAGEYLPLPLPLPLFSRPRAEADPPSPRQLAALILTHAIACVWLAAAGCVEEGTKLIMSRARCCGSPCNSCHPPPLAFVPDVGATAEERSLAAKITLVLIVAASLGFSTIETIGYTAQAGEWSSRVCDSQRGVPMVTSPVPCVLNDCEARRHKRRDVASRHGGAADRRITAASHHLRHVHRRDAHSQPRPVRKCGAWTDHCAAVATGVSPRHCGLCLLCDSLALQLCSRFQLWLGSLWPAVLIHGTFDFALFIAISVDSNPVAASVGVLAFNISLLVASVLVWRRLWRNVLGSIGVSPTPAISPRSLGDAAAILAAAAARRDPGASPPTPPPSLQRGPWRASPQPAPSPMRSPGRVALARAALALSPVSAARASGSASTAAAAAHHAFGGASGARAMASPSRIVDVEVGRSDGVTPDAHDDDGGGGDDEREMLLGGDDTGRRATAPKTAAAAGDEL